MLKIRKLSEQELYWKNECAEAYIARNSNFDHDLGAKAWAKMVSAIEGQLDCYLECGCNIGRNLVQLGKVLPKARPNVIEISKAAFDFVTSKFQIDQCYNGPILESKFSPKSFDLVFTMGVLIHVHPDDLLKTMAKMYDYSNKYVLMGEYFNRTPVMIDYHGQQNRLFKRDFGKLFIENFDCKLVDYGFHWGHIYDSAGFDDITWWLFEKTIR